MLVNDHGADHSPGQTPELINHGEALGLGLGAKNFRHLVIHNLDAPDPGVQDSASA